MHSKLKFRSRDMNMRNRDLVIIYKTVLGKAASTYAKLAYAYCCKLVLWNDHGFGLQYMVKLQRIWQRYGKDEGREPYKHVTTVMLRLRPTLDASAFSK